MRGIKRFFGQVGRRSIFGLTALVMLASQLIFAAPIFAASDSLSGYVTDADANQPVVNAQVEVFVQSLFSATTTTDTSGYYSVSLPTSFTYNVHVTPPSDTNYQPVETVVDVQGPTVLDISMETVDGATITGRVGEVLVYWPPYLNHDTPNYFSGVTVEVYPAGSTTSIATASTDSSGSYSIQGLEPDFYDVTLTLPDPLPPPSIGSGYYQDSHNVKRFLHGGEAQAFYNVDLRNEGADLSFYFSPISVVSGQVTNLNGTPAAGIDVSCSVPFASICGNVVSADNEGYYELPVYPYDQYSITASGVDTITDVDASFDTTLNIGPGLDVDPPILSDPFWSANPQIEGQDTTLFVPASDSFSGVESGEYFIGNDPGEGNGDAMSFENGNITATFGAGLTAGTYTVKIRARDNAGNWSSIEAAELVIEEPDTTPPVIAYELSSQSNAEGWHNTPVILTWTVTDPESEISNQEGCDSVTVDNDTPETVFTCTATSQGGSANESVTIRYDATAPVLSTPEWSANPADAGNDVTLTVPVVDNLSGVVEGEYFIGTDPGETNGITMGWNGTDLSTTFGANWDPGTYVVGIRAKDNAGNWSQVTTTELIVQDVTPPVVDYLLSAQPNANGWYNSNITIDWQAIDPEPSSGTPTDPPDTVASTEGQDVTYTSDPSCDPAGNCATGSVQLSIDKTNPTTGTPTMSGIVTLPLLGSVLLGDTTNISATVGDNLSGVGRTEYYFDTDPGQGNAAAMDLSDNPTNSGTATATAVVSGLSGGQHTLYVRSLDAAGNWSTEATFTFARLF